MVYNYVIFRYIQLTKFENTSFWTKKCRENQSKIGTPKIDTFSSFEHTQNVSIFGESLYLLKSLMKHHKWLWYLNLNKVNFSFVPLVFVDFSPIPCRYPEYALFPAKNSKNSKFSLRKKNYFSQSCACRNLNLYRFYNNVKPFLHEPAWEMTTTNTFDVRWKEMKKYE